MRVSFTWYLTLHKQDTVGLACCTCPIVADTVCYLLVEGDRQKVGTYVSRSLYIRTIQCSDVNTCRQGRRFLCKNVVMQRDLHHSEVYWDR